MLGQDSFRHSMIHSWRCVCVCAAVHWLLVAGLPFKPEFTVSHITQLSSRSGDEVLRAGPTPWGTVLQLPDSWVEAVRAAQLPQDQPLNTPLEVRRLCTRQQ